MRTTEELLGRKNIGSGQENREKRPWECVALTTQHFYPQKLALLRQQAAVARSA
jgi:hypothetical protein